MPLQLSQKERMLLEDEKKQEEICVIKYQTSSDQAQDPELKQLFSTLATEEQHHYDMLDQMLQGQEPNMSHGGSQQTIIPPLRPAPMGNKNDSVLCGDLLSTEKYVSGTYDTGVFEAANPTVRQALQHIQQDEQRHGQMLFNYMNSHGMYQVQ